MQQIQFPKQMQSEVKLDKSYPFWYNVSFNFDAWYIFTEGNSPTMKFFEQRFNPNTDEFEIRFFPDVCGFGIDDEKGFDTVEDCAEYMLDKFSGCLEKTKNNGKISK